MLDFLVIATRSGKRGIIEIYPKFIIKKSSDLMIRGGDFYAIWIEERGLWSTDEQDAVDLIDRELDRYAEENCKRFDDNYRVMHMWDAETGMIDTWHKYCQKQMKDQFHMLDEKLIFSNSKKPIGTQAVVVSDAAVIALTNENNADKKLFETSLKDFMANDSRNVNVTLYNDEKSFLSRVSTLALSKDDSTPNMNIEKNAHSLLSMCI